MYRRTRATKSPARAVSRTCWQELERVFDHFDAASGQPHLGGFSRYFSAQVGYKIEKIKKKLAKKSKTLMWGQGYHWPHIRISKICEKSSNFFSKFREFFCDELIPSRESWLKCERFVSPCLNRLSSFGLVSDPFLLMIGDRFWGTHPNYGIMAPFFATIFFGKKVTKKAKKYSIFFPVFFQLFFRFLSDFFRVFFHGARVGLERFRRKTGGGMRSWQPGSRGCNYGKDSEPAPEWRRVAVAGSRRSAGGLLRRRNFRKGSVSF